MPNLGGRRRRMYYHMAIVYKYYPPNQFTTDALLNGYFFFNKAKNQNDPYETSFNLVGNAKLQEYLLKNCNVDPNADQIMKEYGICCFSKVRNNKRMWAFYAQNYAGLVVGFEDSEFSKLSEKYLARFPYIETKYVEICPTFDDEWEDISPNYITKEDENLPIYLRDVRKDPKACDAFFVNLCSIKEKATWEEEQECRLLAARDVVENQDRLSKLGIEYIPTGYKIPFPLSSVKEIIIGHNFQMGTTFLNGLKAKYPNIDFWGQTECKEPFVVNIKSYNF